MTLRLPAYIDRFLLWLIATVALASVIPPLGRWAAVIDGLADAGIALLFFLHGAKLSRQAIIQGVGHWRLHLLVLASTYVLFPALGLATRGLAGDHVDPWLIAGVLFLTLLPSTVQSSIAFTAMARGNVAAAVCSASLSNLIGIVATPLLVTLFLHLDSAASGGMAAPMRAIGLQLLLPFVAGHLLRPIIGGWVDRHKALLQPIDRAAILLVVFSAFSAAVAGGLWSQVGVADLALLLAISAAILAIVLGANVAVARLANLPREDSVVLLFCGSKKSLASGVPMAGALFDPAHVGTVVLPLMIFHQLQLMVCATIAGRAARRVEARATLPQSEAAMLAAGEQVGLTIPGPCRAGVMANLELLAQHAETMRGGKR